MLKSSEVTKENTLGAERRGYPRPVVYLDESRSTLMRQYPILDKAYPIPYTANDENLADVDVARVEECITQSNCIVCGLGVDEIYAIYSLKDKKFHAEPGPFHLKCAKITMTQCPFFTVRHNPKDFSIVRAEFVSPISLRHKFLISDLFEAV